MCRRYVERSREVFHDVLSELAVLKRQQAEEQCLRDSYQVGRVVQHREGVYMSS